MYVPRCSPVRCESQSLITRRRAERRVTINLSLPHLCLALRCCLCSHWCGRLNARAVKHRKVFVWKGDCGPSWSAGVPEGEVLFSHPQPLTRDVCLPNFPRAEGNILRVPPFGQRHRQTPPYLKATYTPHKVFIDSKTSLGRTLW